jgi:uncharacterized protein DUF3617
MRIRSIVVVSVVLLGMTTARAEGPEIRPGEWEITMQGARKGITFCITPEIVKDVTSLAKAPPNSDCKTTDAKTSGSTRTFSMKCTKPQYESTMTLTVNSPDSFTMKSDYAGTMGDETKKGTMTMTYKRLGECK